MRLILVLALISIIAPLVAIAQEQAPARSVTPAALAPEFMGMVIRDPWFDFDTNPAYPGQPGYFFQDRMGAILSQMGVRWVRLDFHIAAPLNPSSPLPPDFVTREIAKNDYFVNTVAPRYGLKVLGLLSFDLIQGSDAHLLNTMPFTTDQTYGGGVNEYMRVWLDRALQIGDSYGDSIAAYEILNEQNRLPQYIPGGPAGDAITPQIAGRLQTKFYRFCKGIGTAQGPRGCAQAEIIMGGLHPRGTTDAKGQMVLQDWEYLRAIYTDPTSFAGFKAQYGYFPIDGVGYHPYPEEIRLSLRNALVDTGMDRLRQALIQAGDPDRQFWITEVGYNVGFDPDGPLGVRPAQTDAGQAELLRDVYLSLASRKLPDGKPEVARVFWFKYEDFPPATIIYDSQGNPIAYPQRWGVVHIPFANGSCPGGACYQQDGEPSYYRQSYFVYRELAGKPVYRSIMPFIGR